MTPPSDARPRAMARQVRLASGRGDFAGYYEMVEQSWSLGRDDQARLQLFRLGPQEARHGGGGGPDVPSDVRAAQARRGGKGGRRA